MNAGRAAKRREEREFSKAVLFILSGTSLDRPTAAIQSDCSCGAELRPARLCFATPTSLDI